MSSPYSPYPQGGDQGGGYGQPPYEPYPGGSGWEPGTQQGYLQGGPVGFGEAISQAFKNIFTFNGRASRSAFWWFTLFAFIIAVVLDIIGAVSKVTALPYIIEVVIAIVTIGLQVRRLHDTNRSGFWWFIGLIPIVGGIVLLVFDCLPGTPGPNRFG
ncbi:MAG TPA: DUF805 domain-containing protein [Trebonia sp.]|nr:DUF805 domain-containing protein [Trebonia sp.]